jgi:hypothetical protein
MLERIDYNKSTQLNAFGHERTKTMTRKSMRELERQRGPVTG